MEKRMQTSLTWLQFGAGTLVCLLLALHPGPNSVGRWIAIAFAAVNSLVAILRATGSPLLAENRRRRS